MDIKNNWGNFALRDKASRLIEKSNADNMPTDLARIMDYIGFKYHEFMPDRETQKIIGAVNHQDKTIFINSDIADNTQHFTLAHEIAHATLHPEENQIDFRVMPEDRNDDPAFISKEREANVFAYELTLPLTLFCKKYNENNKDLSALSRLFLISPRRIKSRVDFIKKQISSGKLSSDLFEV